MKGLEKKYIVESLTIPADGQPVESNCADITFVNYGDRATPPTGATLIVDDVVRIEPGTQYIIAANNSGEINITKHKINWDTTTGAAIDGIVLRKKFVS